MCPALLLGLVVCGNRADRAWGQAAAAPGTAQTAGPASQASSATVSAAPAQGGVIHGKVVAGVVGKPGGVPLPGVAVLATNTLTGRKYATATDVDGVYTMKIPRNGRYVIRAEFAGFAPATAEVVLSAETAATAKVSDFGLQLASRVEQAAQRETATASAGVGSVAAGTASLMRNLQGLNLSASGGDSEDASAGSPTNSGAAMPSLANLGEAGGSNAADTVAVSGASGQTNGLANFSEDQLRERIQQGVEQARASGQLPPGVDPTNAIVGILGGMMGAPGGPRGGGRGGGGAGRGSGAFRNFNPTQLHGGFNFQGEYAALDSAPWSPTLTPQPKPSYAKDTFGGTLAGSPYIPGLFKPSTKQFGFLNFNVARNTTPEVLTATVPTDAERSGDFSGLVQTLNGSRSGTPIYDPQTGAQFAYNGQPNVIDPGRISPQALYVLNNFYPHANVSGTGTQRFNYQTVTTVGQNSANLSSRFIRNLGANSSGPFFGGGRGGGGGGGGRTPPPGLRQSLNFNFSDSHSASDVRNIILPLSGASQTDGFNFGAGYVIGKGRLNNTSTATWNRSHSLTRNYFTDTPNDPASAAGIALPSTAAIPFRPNFYNGLPSLQIENFLSVNNTNPQDNIAQTISFSDGLSYRHKKHNMRFGVDVRRVHQDYLGGGRPLGQFTFTGFNTEAPCTRFPTSQGCQDQTTTGTSLGSGQPGSGAAFADFLLGLPQQTQIQAGLSKIYLRENVLDWYANDDYRVANGITLNGGMRYEYFGPFSEKNDRLINLTGVSPLASSVGCVTPGGLSVQTVAGTLTCAPGANRSLLQPDRAMYSPRFGVAYRPHWVKDTVIRAGYGINFNTGQFASFARSLSYQAPFAATQNNVLNNVVTNATGCQPLAPGFATNFTLGSGFGCSGKLFENTYAVDPNYRLGLVQVYNADLQRTLPAGIVLNVGYNGSHGSNLNVVNAPNHTANGVTTPDAVAFTYQQSIAESTFNALTVNAQKRLQKGVQLGAKYQYAHSIDDASSINGAAETSSVQDPTNLLAERSNSSFDVRHSLSGTWLYELPVGPNRAFLSRGGAASKVLDGFSLSGSFTITSGRYFTPSYLGTAAQTEAGGTYTLRPDRVFGQPIGGAGRVNSYFNGAAFAYPVSTSGYGTASRYSIEGPGQLLINASLSRTVPLGETRSFEARATASNVFNTVQYNGIDTTLDSATFGQVTGAAAMRQITFVGRFRF